MSREEFWHQEYRRLSNVFDPDFKTKKAAYLARQNWKRCERERKIESEIPGKKKAL